MEMTYAQAFNLVVPAARSARLSGDEHEALKAALIKLKELVEAEESAKLNKMQVKAE